MNGIITDKTTKETLPGANIYASDQRGNPLQTNLGNLGTSSDITGNYSLDQIQGQFVTASMIGYQRSTKKAIFNRMDFHLQPAAYGLDEVVIVGKIPGRKIQLDDFKMPAIFLILGILAYIIYKNA